MSTSYLLGVDIGTSGSKGVIIYRRSGQSVESIEHGISIPKPMGGARCGRNLVGRFLPAPATINGKSKYQPL